MTDIVVTSEEMKRYGDVCFKLAGPFFQREFPDTIWHYTNGTALIEILRTGQVWLTQISCLNDSTEFMYGRDLYCKAVERLEPKSEDEIYIKDWIVDSLKSSSTFDDPWFITCFSAVPNDLSQWRAYGGGENGYSIGFDAKKLADIARQMDIILFPVNYDDALHIKITDELARVTIDQFLQGLKDRPNCDREEWRKKFVNAWGWQIAQFQALMKDKDFHAEAEWRLVYRRNGNDFGRIEYRQKTSMMSRHLPIKYPLLDDVTSNLLPIREIMVGPGRHKIVSEVSVNSLLRTCCYPETVKVTHSSTPYQGT